MESKVLVFAVALCCVLVNARYLRDPATPCDAAKCKLPDCRCSTTDIPGDLPASRTPQIVMVSFDDAVNGQNMRFYQSLFPDKKNPNNCTIAATYFVSHEYTDYVMLNKLYHQRHAIADHTITHRTPTTWWKQANLTQWQQEILGQRDILANVGFVNQEDIVGFRAPFLQIGGNKEFSVLHDAKFLFETSMPAPINEAPLWPYTLDYRSTQTCQIPPCPTDSYPGLWEVPMVDYVDKNGNLCNMVDGCAAPTSEEDAYELFESNFNRHYKTNRAPFPMFFHAEWFSHYPYTLAATNRFLRKLESMPDVWVVTIPQAIQWVRKPTPLDKIDDFDPWKCNNDPPVQRCDTSSQTVCGYDVNRRLVEPGQPATHYLFSCLSTCLQCYPWVGDPRGENCNKLRF